MAARVSKQLRSKLAQVQLLLCDVDGVLTDGTVTIGQGVESKRFHIQDGLAMHVVRRLGIKVGWISNRPSAATQQRAEELKIDFLHQDKGSKVETIETILARENLSWPQVCFVGDDLVDLGALQRAGVGVAVANAIVEAKEVADYVTVAPGGGGAVREVIRLILVAQNKWDGVVLEFTGPKG